LCYSTLPDTLIGNTALLQLYSLHRQLLADTLLRDRLDLESTGDTHMSNVSYMALYVSNYQTDI